MDASNNQVAQLASELALKNDELRKLYKLVNGLKDRITNLEIAVADRDVQIEDLNSALSANAGA
ncbi:hypothetical protein [Devosia sp. 2618]|uniref:hypothetical protein n=1 Tax=Devosia sp. 2618 TaxID=3156454 RepID=UPI00339A07D1